MIKLTPKAFAVLSYLIEHPGRIVTKEELFAAVWPETVVSDTALSVCVREFRKSLEDEAKTPQYIETVHRRGFRFIAPVAAVAAPVPSFEFQVPSQAEGVRSQYSVVNSQEEERQKPALSFAEGANGDNLGQAEGVS